MAPADKNISIVWFRRDLRLHDNPALSAACKKSDIVIPIFLWDPAPATEVRIGGASQWWLHHSLTSLAESIAHNGSRLILRLGSTLDCLQLLFRETGAKHLFFNRCYEPFLINEQKNVEEYFSNIGIAVSSFNASLLKEPSDIRTSSGGPYQVFTPFWRQLRGSYLTCRPLPKPRDLKPLQTQILGEPVASLALLAVNDWADGLRQNWLPGEKTARDTLKRFAGNGAAKYGDLRDIPSKAGTSKLSPHLHFGELSPKQVWWEFEKTADLREGETSAGEELFLRQIGWREFAHHLLFHLPHTTSQPLRQEFLDFPWKRDRAALGRWQKGLTGYPIVDAGMRELWISGWMHNRVRMIVASFLVKDLLQPWQDGAQWFWDTLVDADLANNTFGWQWTAGCGADAAPYFRIFNPVLQSKRFDPTGEYIRRWLPDLQKLPDKWIHEPWECPSEILEKAGVKLGQTYPEPIVNHHEARDLALEAYEELPKRGNRKKSD